MNGNSDSNVANNKPEDMAEESQKGVKYGDPNLFPADKLIRDNADNLATSEAQTNENPLRTENTEAENDDVDSEEDNDDEVDAVVGDATIEADDES